MLSEALSLMIHNHVKHYIGPLFIIRKILICRLVQMGMLFGQCTLPDRHRSYISSQNYRYTNKNLTCLYNPLINNTFVKFLYIL